MNDAEDALDQLTVVCWFVVAMIVGVLTIYVLPRDLYSVYECTSASLATAESYMGCLVRLNSAGITLDSGFSLMIEGGLANFAVLRQLVLALVIVYLVARVVRSIISSMRSNNE